jgi:hypothetical protein
MKDCDKLMTLELHISEPRTSACNEMSADNAVHILCTQIRNSQPQTVHISLTKQVQSTLSFWTVLCDNT